MLSLFIALILLSLGYVTARLSEESGRNPFVWFFIGMFTGIFGILFLLLLPSKKEAEIIDFTEEIENPMENDQKKELYNSDWFYMSFDEKEKGPIPFKDLSLAYGDGIINTETYIWREGMPNWIKASQIPNLIHYLEEDIKREQE